MDDCKKCQHHAWKQNARPASFVELFCRKGRKAMRKCGEFKARTA